MAVINMNQVWTSIQDSLRDKLGPQNYDIWIQFIECRQTDETSVQLCVPNRYYRDWIQANYGAILCAELNSACDLNVDVEFHIGTSESSANGQTDQSQGANGSSINGSANGSAMSISNKTGNQQSATHKVIQQSNQSSLISGVQADKTFSNFVVGASNQFAHAAAKAVEETPGQPDYNPLFIYGGTGLGKTHLLHAIGNSVRNRDPNAQVVYVSAERFTNELIDALRYKQMPEFRDKFRKLPTLLLMDDVQFFSGKERIQEELFHTFEWLKDRGRQIVFTSDVLPREIKGFAQRLRTRCESGMLADVQPPDLETLTAILHAKAEDQSMPLSPELANYIAPRVQGSVRELEGILHRLKALCKLTKVTHPTVSFCQEHMGSVLNGEVRAPTAEEIIQTVSTFYNLKVSDVMGTRRLKQLVRPRHVAMWLVRKHTNLSFPDIGRAFGRDHATVQHACKKIRTELQRDADLQSAVATLTRNLGR